MSAVGISTYCWRNCFVWVLTNTLTHYLYGKTYTYKNNNKFFSIYNYLFRFFCLFGFQWTVFASFLLAGRPKWTRTTFKTYLSLCSRKGAYAFKGFVVYLVLLVGPSGLEPPTSCLSGTRSNLLSYEPMWLVSDFSSLGWWRWWDSILARTTRSVFLGRKRPPEVCSVPIPLRILLCE